MIENIATATTATTAPETAPSDSRFTIRYRQSTIIGTAAVLVEDTAGKLHVYAGGGLHPYLRDTDDAERRRVTLQGLGWVPVPRVAPYTLAELRRLFGPRAA